MAREAGGKTGRGGYTIHVSGANHGTGSRRLVIRAVGPGLATFGVTGTMPDPKLELYSGPTRTNENDNWDATTLNPGSYTVQVTGGTTGVALGEAYEAT